ncbi:hypothetical protein FHS77_001768 [Paenochrobactrum gallinarii]|uniref:Uncharacterized protein n=1 Tax=Paenochrobactrum gallinarii TaxID=643673 RepID=A0A841M4Y0_9HYPH|nr:hypothetical protein [Paenochrobactrum gallinarii]
MCIENWPNYVTAISSDAIWPNLVRRHGTIRLLLRYLTLKRVSNLSLVLIMDASDFRFGG